MSFFFSEFVFHSIDVIAIAEAEAFEDLEEGLEVIEGVVVGAVDDAREVKDAGSEVGEHDDDLMEDGVEILY